MGYQPTSERVVIPITKGRVLKEKRQRYPIPPEEDESPALRRLIQCVEMMAELTKEVAKKR